MQYCSHLHSVFIIFRHIRQRSKYEHNDIDSSPEAYRNVTIPNAHKLVDDENRKNIFDTKDLSHFQSDKPDCIEKRPNFLEDRTKVNLYLRRRRSNSNVEEKDWIIIRKDCIL